MDTEYSPAMPFGKYRDVPIVQVPASYLGWALRECKLSTGLRKALEAELGARGLTAPRATPRPTPPLRCDRCGTPARVLLGWMQDCRGQRRIQRLCGCGRSLGFAPHTEENVALADASQSQTPVLDVLTECEALGIELKSDGQAVHVGQGWDRLTPALRQRIAQCRHELAVMMGKGACA